MSRTRTRVFWPKGSGLIMIFSRGKMGTSSTLGVLWMCVGESCHHLLSVLSFQNPHVLGLRALRFPGQLHRNKLLAFSISNIDPAWTRVLERADHGTCWRRSCSNLC